MPFIRTENDKVVQHINIIPENSPYEWKEVVIIRPEINVEKQKYGVYYYDLSKTPAEMIYPLEELTEEERKTKLLFLNKRKHRELIEGEIQKEFGFNGNKECENCDLTHITNCVNNYRTKKQQIESCKTHEDLDAITISN